MKPSGGGSLEDGPFGVHTLPVPEPTVRTPYDKKEEEDSAVKSGEEPPTRGNMHYTVLYAGLQFNTEVGIIQVLQTCFYVWFDSS